VSGIVSFSSLVGDDGSLVPDAAAEPLIAGARALRADDATRRAIQAVLETHHPQEAAAGRAAPYAGRAEAAHGSIAPALRPGVFLAWPSSSLSPGLEREYAGGCGR
jgi:hypothetical protein